MTTSQPPANPYKPATQKMVAERAGVSLATVSHILTGRAERYNEETRHKVLQAVEALEYRPHRGAQAMRKGRSYSIGAIFQPALFHAPQERMKLLAQTVLKYGYQLTPIDLSWFQGNLASIETNILDANVDGLILCNLLMATPPRWVETLLKRNTPLVALGNQLPIPIDAVFSDILQSYHDLTRHHIEQGSRRLTLLLSYWDAPVETLVKILSDRIEGFSQAIYEAGGTIEFPCGWPPLLEKPKSRKPSSKKNGIIGEIIYPERRDAWGHNPFKMGKLLTDELIRSNRVPDSLLCSNDEIAAGAITACISHQIAIPQRLKVSGTDNAPFSAYCGIPLTTIAQPAQALSEWAIERLVSLIEKRSPTCPPQLQSFPCELVIRDSTLLQS